MEDDSKVEFVVGVGGVLFNHGTRDTVHVGLHLCEREAGLDASENFEAVTATVVFAQILGCEGERSPDFSLAGIRESIRHDADNGIVSAVDADSGADDDGISSEDSTPERVTQDDFAIVTGLGFFGLEVAAVLRLNAQHAEEIRRGGGADDALRTNLNPEVEGASTNCSEIRKAVIELLEVAKLWCGDPILVIGCSY